ncbi:MAG: xanthine dehydrogenase family protein molybdopterin-binding subunit [Alphaproteobacteria bacterium]|nr:xanthine dehydrogenase family protein molybdopterin-binding subunit [Alphaproteobacteria bacterium]
MTYIGKNQARLEDEPLLRGEGRFASDISFPDQLHMRVVRAPVAYGRLGDINADHAKEIPGVFAVWTAKDVMEIGPIPFRQVNLPGMERFAQYVLARGYVRYVGDPMAVVFADDPYVAEDAADLVTAEIEVLAPCLDATGPVGEFEPGVPAVAGVVEKKYGDLIDAFARAEHVVKLRLKIGRHAGIPLETRGCVATFDPADSMIRLYGAAKIPHKNRITIAAMIDHPVEKIHLHEGHVGGGFGTRGEVYPEDVLVCLAARRFKRPIKWIEDRRENLIAANHSRQQTHEIRAAVDGRGFILGVDDVFWLDQGGYVRTHGGAVSELTAAMLPGPYVWPAYRSVGHIRLTNKTPCGTYRAPGRYEGSFVRERLMDAIARELGLDPVELRRVNLIPEDSMPFDRKIDALGTEIILDSGKYEDLLDRLLERVGYDRLKAEIEQRRADGEMVGMGLAFFVEKSGLGPHDDAKLNLQADGRVEILTGTASVGQGVETVMAQIGADATGLPIEAFYVTHGQTDRIDHGMGAYASRATTMSGTAVHLAGQIFNSNLRQAAADMLQTEAQGLTISNGRIHRTNDEHGPALTLATLAGDYHKTHGAPLTAEATFHAERMGFPYGIHLVVARIAPDTMEIQLEKLVIAFDVGKAINPMLIGGQFAGAAAQGIGGALFEEFVYDEGGQPLATNFADYLLPTVHEVPKVEILLREDAPSPLNPLGIKGAGEGGITGTGAAIAAAVDDAIGGGGAIDALPISPARLHQLIEKLGR